MLLMLNIHALTPEATVSHTLIETRAKLLQILQNLKIVYHSYI